MTTIMIIFMVILGASLGSFLSVIIHRISKKQKGILWGRSACPHCKKTLQPKDLIPLVSYIMLRGKCRYCPAKITPHYFFLELISALTTVLLYLKFPFIIETNGAEFISFILPNFLQFIWMLVIALLAIGIFFYDLQAMEIPDLFLFPLIFITLFGNLLSGQHDYMDLLIAFLIALVVFGSQVLLSRGKWLGEGDLYVAVAMAFLFGWKLFLVSIVVTYILGAIIGIALLATKNAETKSQIPFAPFMVLGIFITIFFGQDILSWYMHLLAF